MANYKCEPAPGRYLVDPLQLGEKTDGGVFLPEQSRYLTREAIILEVGGAKDAIFANDENRAASARYQKGDRIVYTPYSGSSFKLNGKDVTMLEERDIICRLTPVDDEPPIGINDHA